MIRRFPVSLVLTLALASTCLMAQTPSQFSADMKLTGRGVAATGKLYSAPPKVRMEMNTSGHQSTIISDSDRKIAYMLMPNNMYMEVSTEAKGQKQGPNWRMYDPANPCANMPEMTCQKVGTGMADGQLCNKWLFTNKKGGSTMTVWISQKSGIPIRTETSDGSTMELLNIKPGPQPASLFQVPAGYKKLDMGNIGSMMKNMQKHQGGDED